MTPENDKNFRMELAISATERLLSKMLIGQIIVLVALVAMQFGLLFWVGGQCTTIYGLSMEGRIYETDSFTCPNPSVEPVFNHGKQAGIQK